MSKYLEEKKNDLLTRAEEVLNLAKSEKRELTEAEAEELAEIKDDIRKIKETLKMDDDFRELADMEKKTDMDFIIKKTPNQSYQVIPMQFTTS